jgi:homoserine kinase
MAMSESITIQVPASTANLGPGYDCLGIALQLYNRVTLRRTEVNVPLDPMADQAGSAFFRAARVPPFPFAWEITGDVPRSRGLGSSVTVRLGILLGLNTLTDAPLVPEQIFELCAALEGHPDNAAPAAFGGFTVAGGRKLARFEVGHELSFVLLIPSFEVSTPQARSVLPPQLDRLSAVRSCTNACRITAAFASADYEGLRGSFGDGLHQPFREKLIPFLSKVIAAGESAGALGGFLSGSGSTICCVTLENPELVAQSMLAAAAPKARTIITHADNQGMMLV